MDEPQPIVTGRRPFVHLRLHTAYSLSEGAIRIRDVPELCRRFAMPAAAITDRSNLFGALEFSETLTAAGIQPVIGCSLAVEWPSPETEMRSPSSQIPRRERFLPALALLAQSEAGYRNLMRLSSQAYRRGRDTDLPHVTIEDLTHNAQGLIALTGGREGPIDQFLLRGAVDQAEELLLGLARLFPDRLYVEVQRHDDVSAETLPQLVDFAYRLGLPLVATNEPYFATPDLAEAHDALICIAQGAVVSDEDRRRLTPEHYFKSPEEMSELFSDLPEAFDMASEIARRCAFVPRLQAPILPKFEPETGLDEAQELRRQAGEGLADRFKSGELYAEEHEYRERLEFELDVIIRMNFAGYFLIVADFIKWAKTNGIPVGPGRGSGAGSVVSWALTITDLDPLRFNLLFERFLNPERVSMPDFDIDFCQERRDEVIRYVQDKYGHDRVAQIITFGKLQVRAVVRDVGRVLQMPYGQVDRICKLIPNNPANPVNLSQAIEGEPELTDMMERDAAVRDLMAIALKLEGLYRHASTHAAGVVIGDRPLEDLIPLYYDPRSSMPVTQFNLTWVEPAGLVKFDFLGLKTLTLIDKVCRALKRRGVELDMKTLPLEDPETYAMLSRGDSYGVFQFEGAGMRDLLCQVEPTNLEDLIALVALYRPGPMQDIPKYVACKHGRETPEVLHPSLKPIVADTYGVIVYQEQVMQIAQVLSGYSLGEADLLRRAMGKKKKDEMAQQKDRFIDGAVKNGVDRGQADHIFELIAKFAGYGFNKSHAAGYALIAYQTAYLKANYPGEFYAASMTLDINNTDKLAGFRKDAIAHGIAFLPPDINASEADFIARDGKVQYGLAAIKNVGLEAMRHVVEVRRTGGPFRDPFDFAQRIDPRHVNKRTFENLVRAGAFDRLHPNRAQLVQSQDILLSHAAHAAEERVSAQVSLFGDKLEKLATPTLPDVEDWSPIERLNEEMAAVGFYLSGHPLEGYEALLKRRNVSLYGELRDGENTDSKIVNVAGIVHQMQRRRSRRNDLPMAFVTLSDPSGSYDVTVLSDTLSAHGDAFVPGTAVVVTAIAQWEGPTARLTAKAVRPLDQLVRQEVSGFRVFVKTADPLPGVHEALAGVAARNGSGSERISTVTLVLLLDGDGEEVDVELPGRYPADMRVKGALKAVPGVVDVQET